MIHYSEARKQAIIKKLLPPLNKTFREISRAEGIPLATLYNWKKRFNGSGESFMRIVKDTVEWSAEARFAAIIETAKMTELEVGEYCRQKGLYPEQISSWRADVILGLSKQPSEVKWSKVRDKHYQKQISELERELKRKEKALAEAAALLVLRKKLRAFYGEDNEED
jgi:transposase